MRRLVQAFGRTIALVLAYMFLLTALSSETAAADRYSRDNPTLCPSASSAVFVAE